MIVVTRTISERIFFLMITINVIHSTLIPQKIETYPSEPVWKGYLADPFTFKANDTYYMIGTGLGEGGYTFPALISKDFVTWNYSSAILHTVAQAGQPSAYWAPEIAQHGNIFYLFYSAGFDDKNHRLRVASSCSPLGPFNDSEAKELTNVTKLSFAIDPHPFQDPADGQWYLFYSRDFLDTNDGYRVGTGIVVDRLMNNMTRLAGEEKVVLRAKHDWQLYESNRSIYGGYYDWYTLEGAATWQQESGKYVCFYSGSNWQTSLYGVDYAVSSSPIGPYEEDSKDQARITHSVPGVIIGPGHNSIVLGPDQRTTYIIYHGWNEEKTIRSPYVSQLDWKYSPSNNSSSGQDLLHVTLFFLAYCVFLLLLFHHTL